MIENPKCVCLVIFIEQHLRVDVYNIICNFKKILTNTD